MGVLSSVGGGVLSGIITSALDRARAKGGGHVPSQAELEGKIAGEIGRVLAAGDASAQALRAEIAALLKQIDAGEIMLHAAIEEGSERVRSDVIAVIGGLGSGFAEMGFLIKDVLQVAAGIQESLDAQGADVRVIKEQNNRQSTDIRLIREGLTAIASRTRDTGPDGAATEDGGPRWVHGCPYRGLLPFEENDAEVFYGRERLTAELAVTLAARVTRGGLVVVTGASGAGKSSLLRAGLLPALARGQQVAGSEHWPRIAITPTGDPLGELATHLAALGNSQAVEVRQGLARDPGQAHLAVRQAALAYAASRDHTLPAGGSAARLLLIVDQFEEVFTLNPGAGGEAARQAFITALCAAASSPDGPKQEPPALVVIAVRGDFWDQCAAYTELAGALHDGQFVVGPMTESDLRLAITGPARAAGLHIDPNLTETVLSDLRVAGGGDDAAGVLPLLSQAMRLTWEKREGDRLTSHGYSQAGGVSHAVQTSADKVYDAFPAGQQSLARELLRSMTVASRDGRLTRRPVTRADLCAGHPGADRSQVDAVLEAFAAERLIVLNEGTAQISHDALLSAWPKLREWLEDDRASWILHGQLADDAVAWRDHHDDPSFLYRGTQLAAVRQAASRWSADPRRYPALTGTEKGFLRASDRAAARSARQRRALAAALVVLLIASLGAAWIAARTARNADKQRVVAVSGQLAAQSETFDIADPVQAAELALAAWRIAPTRLAYDSLLDVLAQPGRGILTAGKGGVYAAAFSPDGKIVATGGTDGTVRLWDVATHRQIGGPLPLGGSVTGIAFSRDGRILATASADGIAQLWNVASGQQIGMPMIAGPRLSIAAGSFGTAVAFSPDGKTLATGSWDGAILFWDVAAQRQIGRPLNAGGAVGEVAFSPDGKALATGILDGTIQLWNAASHRQIGLPLRANNRFVQAIAFSPDGRILATAGLTGGVQMWDVASHRQIGGSLSGSAGVSALAWSPDGRTLATGGANGGADGTAQLWDVTTHGGISEPLNAGNSKVTWVGFSPDGKTLGTADADGTVRLWDVANYQQIGRPLSTDGRLVNEVAFSPDGKILVTATSQATASQVGTAQLWDVATQQPIGAPLVAGGGAVYQVAFTPDGKVLATADASGTVRLWDLASHRQIGDPLRAASQPVRAVAFSPDGKILATGSADGTARLWGVAARRQIGEPLHAVGIVYGLAFSPDGKILATGTADGTARFWDVATRRQIGDSLPTDGSSVDDVAFSPDGKIVATGSFDGTARLWGVAARRQIGEPLNAVGSVIGVAFSPDGKIVATGSVGGAARLWDVATQQQIGSSLPPIGGSVGSVAFSPDGKILATAGADGTARLWDVASPQGFLRAVCAIAGGRALTPQQWNAVAPSEPFKLTCP